MEVQSFKSFRRALRSPKADVTLEKITSSILGGGM
jgi:hypothetical protein